MEPAESGSGEGAFYVVALGGCFQADLAKTIGPDGLPDPLGLGGQGGFVSLGAEEEDLGVEQIAAGMKFAIAFAEQIFVDPGEIKASDAVSLDREQRGDEAGALGPTGNAGAGHGPLVRPGETEGERVQSRQGHGGGAAGAVGRG